MRKRLFAIPSLLLAGMLPARVEALPPIEGLEPSVGKDGKSLFDIFKRDHIFQLAGHRSLSSHRSHSSHQSHRSSTGGGYSFSSPAPRYHSPSPRYLTPPPSVPLSPPPAPAPEVVQQPQALVTLPGNSNKFKLIVIQVQNALALFGYPVPVDGAVGTETREALRRFQGDWSLKQTGTVTPEVLDALGISAR